MIVVLAKFAVEVIALLRLCALLLVAVLFEMFDESVVVCTNFFANVFSLLCRCVLQPSVATVPRVTVGIVVVVVVVVVVVGVGFFRCRL